MATLFVAFLIIGVCSLKHLGVSSELPQNNVSIEDLAEVVTSKYFENADILFIDDLENSTHLNLTNFPENEFPLKLEPLVSDPLFEDILWNTTVSKGMNQKRGVPQKGLSHEAKMHILQLHNIYRGNVTPPAGDMTYLEWDDEHARLAQIWSDRCVFQHGYPGPPMSQNLYFGMDPTGASAVWLWYEEHQYYDIHQDYCIPGKECNHYKAMAWAKSNKIGCGIAKCENKYLLTCHYTPLAVAGEKIYRIAEPCSQCSSGNGALCVKNLCMTREQCKRNPFVCDFSECNLECHNCGRLDKENCRCECMDGWDSADCSVLCGNEDPNCGKNPGYPTKAFCSFLNYGVANDYCREMCEMCSVVDYERTKYTCCNGTLCENGYVLDPDDSCKCKILCPGPICDSKEEIEEKVEFQASKHRSSGVCSRLNIFLIIWIFITWAFLKINANIFESST